VVVIESRTFDEIRAGESASLTRSAGPEHSPATRVASCAATLVFARRGPKY